jgi:hypothetical protein
MAMSEVGVSDHYTDEEEESISTQLHVRRPVGTMMEKSGVRRGGRLNKS